MSTFRLNHLQHNVVFGSKRRRWGAALGFDIVQADNVIAWIDSAMQSGLIAPERESTSEPRHHETITISFARHALDALGIAYQWNAAAAEDAFAAGMAARSNLLGDAGPSAPTEWDTGWGDDPPHVMLWITASSADDRDEVCQGALRALGDSVSLKVDERLEQIFNNDDQPIEHFGYRDGISQPWITHVHPAVDPRREGGGRTTKEGIERIELGEFILGHTDSSGDTFPVPSPAGFFEDGTFMVLRKLEQDVPAFRAISENGVGSRLMGRHPNGTPLAEMGDDLAPDDPRALNGFTYGSDPEGFACPMGAHVRRSNPRDALGFGGLRSYRHRIIRRGMTYGERLPEGQDSEQSNDTGKRGLMFVAFNSRIHDQFEFIQSRWLNDGVPFKLGSVPDLIAGNFDGAAHALLHERSAPPTVVTTDPLVVTRGGGYYFVPGIKGLRYLVGLRR